MIDDTVVQRAFAGVFGLWMRRRPATEMDYLRDFSTRVLHFDVAHWTLAGTALDYFRNAMASGYFRVKVHPEFAALPPIELIRKMLSAAFPNDVTIAHAGPTRHFIVVPTDWEGDDDSGAFDDAVEAVRRRQTGQFGELTVVAELEPNVLYHHQEDYCVQVQTRIQPQENPFTAMVCITRSFEFVTSGQYLMRTGPGMVMAVNVHSDQDFAPLELNPKPLHPIAPTHQETAVAAGIDRGWSLVSRATSSEPTREGRDQGEPRMLGVHYCIIGGVVWKPTGGTELTGFVRNLDGVLESVATAPGWTAGAPVEPAAVAAVVSERAV